MTKAEKKILNNIKKSNGMTNPILASNMTGYKVSTTRRYFKKLIDANIVKVVRENGFNFYHVI